MNAHTSPFLVSAIAASAWVLLPAIAPAQDIAVTKEDISVGKKQYSPYLHQSYPNRVFWGDTHLHTSYSTDAGMVGNTLGPEEALRFARGEQVISSTGVPARLIRPLDFLVVADHSENLGLAPMIEESNPELLKDPMGKKYHDLVKSGKGWEAYQLWKKSGAERKDSMPNPALQRTAWDEIIDAVDQYNQPGVFTAFHGFEWTSTPDLRNLHRNVIFRDDAKAARQVLPFSFFDSADPEDLWDYMEAYEKKTGGRALAIPHGGNLSQGLMFAVETMSGQPIDAAYAKRRMHWEPIYEVTQMKGDGEAHPLLSPTDEFADYYQWDKGDFGLNPKEPQMLPHEYARSALRIGLEQQARLGVNPFKFGMIGSTDSHTSLATTREENYFGKFAGAEPGTEARFDDLVSQDLREDGDGSLNVYHWESLASGLAGVWATENTREAIWDAMARKEVYATTGTRMLVRVFAGWDFEPEEVQRPDFAPQGYQRGVPMGGGLTGAPEGVSPKFMVRALRDADGANLDRIQIIKGWVDADGKSRERVFDIAVSGGRKIDEDGRCKTPVGDTVDVPNASYTNTIGDAVLAGYWEDPTFDPTQRAFYYVRVLEIPTPSWIAYDEKIFGTHAPDRALRKQQERAYTSPIWYSPSS
ncbi:DUF3604 domain-containing protein [Methyloceanibacter caenitepidi]|uniref:DUF3604 domain-containing protein n=1 Tax=Methyloceanibacter caenitepidi TaxID=1384459 RepID=A0A0A8K207_9HYPH|nr:DUF3604 domain-containing protein [Methyloceanibacter caenitepidi]BAQ16557.1 hypothetical protein GL4_1097 [Methyloceanibacter caenitepidi]